MTSWHKTGAHPLYIGMYLHIYTHMDVHKFTSQKECLHIFVWHPDYLYTNLCFTRITRRNALLCIFPCPFQRKGRILMHVLIHLELAMQVKSALGSFAQMWCTVSRNATQCCHCGDHLKKGWYLRLGAVVENPGPILYEKPLIRRFLMWFR